MSIHTDYENSQIDVDHILPGFSKAFEDASVDGRSELSRSLEDYTKIAQFSAEIGVPFCVERNQAYAAPHAVLHEIAHWRVKPDSYINVYRELSHRDFGIYGARLVIDKIFTGQETVVENFTYYQGNNDRMPDWDLPDGLDPTPNEKAVRAWTRHAIDYLGIRDPIISGRNREYFARGIGDSVIAKGSSFRTWAASAISHPRAVAEFEAFGLDPANGSFIPDESTLILPHAAPKKFVELEENVEAMVEQHPGLSYKYEGQLADWEDHLRWKFPDLRF